MKILLNSKDVSVFLACTELCQKIKEKVLQELFEIDMQNYNLYVNLFSNAHRDFGDINRLDLINGIISEKLKELKKKEESTRLKELKKIKKLERIKLSKIKKYRGKFHL